MPARTPIDVATRGPQVGQPVPNFSLKDQAGKTWTRQSIMGPPGAMLVLNPAAEWAVGPDKDDPYTGP